MTAGRSMRPLPALLAAGLLGLLAVAPVSADAQGLVAKSGNRPVTIRADDGIEWLREQKKYIARGNATATRNNATIRADRLTAYYRDKAGEGGQEIFRVDADGNVRITANDQEAQGDKGVYYVDKAVFVLVGKKLRLLSKQGTLTARDSLEYWEDRRLAVARGDATVVQQNQRIRADVLTAHVTGQDAAGKKSAKSSGSRKKTKGKSTSSNGKDQPQGSGQIRQVDAFGHVHISLQNAIIRGDRGVYLPANGVATICGNVRITSGNNQLNGKCAEVNLKTGIYRLTGRAKGLLEPKKKGH